MIILPTAPTLHAELPKLASRWLPDLERHLQERGWIACADFTVADIMMSSFLSGIRRTRISSRNKGKYKGAQACHILQGLAQYLSSTFPALVWA